MLSNLQPNYLIIATFIITIGLVYTQDDATTILSTADDVTNSPVIMERNHTSKLPDLTTTAISKSSSDIASFDNVVGNKVTANDDVGFPSNCSFREKFIHQPIQQSSSRLKKCCPRGESILIDKNGQQRYCESTTFDFQPEIIEAILYENCIEDTGNDVELDIIVENPCNQSIMYSHSGGDKLYVLQDGTLLVMDEFRNDSFEIKSDYCLDSDYGTGEIYAFVCVTSIKDHIGRGQTILFAILMLLSLPCLIAVCFFHFAIKELRTVHGLSLGCLSVCICLGFFLHSVAQLGENYKSTLGYVVQFFMLAYFFWLLALCSNVVVNVWVYIRLYMPITRTIRYTQLSAYSLICTVVPITFVLVTKYKGLPGMPSYFFQGITESVRESQRYFIPPVTFILLTCFILLVCAFFGFRHLEKILNTRENVGYSMIARNGIDHARLPTIDRQLYDETKKDAKCIALLFIIIITTWISEVVTFYAPGPEDYLAFMEIINGLQGLFIMTIFIIVRRRRDVIKRWWHDRGSHVVTEIEMQPRK